jgi:peptidoglycan-associated lipoprotein
MYNTAGPAVGSFKVLRGGSWYDKDVSKIRSSYRFWLDPAERYGYTGLRCAADEMYVEQPTPAEEVVGKVAEVPVAEQEEKVGEVPLVGKEEKVELVPAEKIVAQPEAAEKAYFEDIYFDFDKDSIRGDSKTALKTLTDWLLRNPEAAILIEGHCDERGTNEYNLALGERRAKSARKYLIGMGVAGERLHTISYGAERPLCTEHSNACWKKNRRVHFVLIRDAANPEK